jgi:hypothetical protein
VFERTNANGHIGWRPPRSLLALLPVGVLVLAAAVVVVILLDPGALRALPALALPALLALRRYPGERMLVVLSEPRRSRRRRPQSTPIPARPRIAMPRGGLLLALSLAVRPPPGVPLAAA